MPLTNTLDITLLGAAKGQPAFVAARMGKEIGFATLPEDGTIPQLLEMRDKIEASFYGRANVTTQDLEAYGEQLGGILLADAVGEMYRAARANGVRINLVINDCDLQRLPWEYLHEKREDPGPQGNRALVRIVSTSEQAAAVPVQLPQTLSVLLLVSRGPNDLVVPLEDLTKSMEVKFSTWLQHVKVDLVVRPVDSFESFSNAIRARPARWDVIHFLGHGEVRNVKGRLTSGLLIAGAKNQTFFLDALKLAALLDGRQPRLLILSACATGQAQARAQFSNLAGVLLRRNTPAVLGNQMVITADSVAGFCAGVYDKLLETGDIDEAVVAGRLHSYGTLLADSSDIARVEWGVPVLYRHVGAQSLFA